MQRLGDVIFTRRNIREFFGRGNLPVEIIPYDWFSMLDKLLLKMLPKSFENWVRKLPKLWWLDRLIPVNGLTLWFAGSVMTHISKPK